MTAKNTTFSEISPSEFFYRNRDLAGFTNPARALYSAVRELVENSLDATELFGILPEVYVRIITEASDPDYPDPKPYRLSVWDNGPGVDPQHVPSARRLGPCARARHQGVRPAARAARPAARRSPAQPHRLLAARS